MLRAKRMAFLIVGTLLSTAGSADDGILEYASRWQLTHPIETMAYANDWPQPMDNFDFQDSGILGRASKLRGLSFLTLAELGRARLFLGVNKEGLFGLHFRAFSRHSSGRYLELARMPYLKNSQPDTETE